MIKNLLMAMIVLVAFSACESKKTLNYAENFPDSVVIVADELDKDMSVNRGETIVFTSLVDLNDFKESSNFGRLFSESLMTQLSRRGFNVLEYRGNEVVSKIKKGEFKLNRAKIQEVDDKNVLVLVGTYSKMDDSVIVNVRVVNKETNVLASAASVYIPLNIAKKSTIVKEKEKFMVEIVPSSCSESDYCWKDIN